MATEHTQAPFDLETVTHFYAETGYYPGPIAERFVQTFSMRDRIFQTEIGDRTLWQRLGSGTAAHVIMTPDQRVFKIAKTAEKQATLLMEVTVNQDLKRRFDRFKIRTDEIVAAQPEGLYLEKKFMESERMAERMRDLNSLQAQKLEELFFNARAYAEETGIGLDLKASNLYWDGEDWVLFDSQPRMGYLPYGYTLDIPDFATYLEHWNSYDPPKLPSGNLTLGTMLQRLKDKKLCLTLLE